MESQHFPDEQFSLTDDSLPRPGVARGRVDEFLLPDSREYPGFEHRWWLYRPAAPGSTPLASMVFLDGTAFLADTGHFRAATVLDNLIADEALPPLAAVFVDAGRRTVAVEKDERGVPLTGDVNVSNRDIEYYEEESGRYAGFLETEILPLVAERVAISSDPDDRGIAGLSGGAIAAFSAAWHRSDLFRRVYATLGSFTTRPDGSGYPPLVRDAPRKPIRAFFQAGRRDAIHSRWGYGEERHAELTAALDLVGYDYRYVLGEGGHHTAHGGVLLPEALRWLWRG